MRRNYLKRHILFITTFIFSLSLCFSVTTAYINMKGDMEYSQMEQVVLINSNKINNVITKLLYKTQVLAALVVQNDGSVLDFERVAATILDDPAIKNVLIAPEGIVSNVYPKEGNEGVIGLNFFEPGNGNVEAIEARNSKQLVLGGPFDLVEGGQALVGRLPVYKKDDDGNEKFWGLVSVALHYPQALAGAELDHLQTQGFAYEIWRTSPDSGEKQIISSSEYAYDHNARYIEKSITILNATWQFRISPIEHWMQYPETWIFSIVGLFISFMAAFFVLNTYHLKEMKTELEALSYIDPLTGVLNRRGMLNALVELMNTSKRRLILCYMDLNKFKQINDTFGHSIGDKVLQQFSATITKHTDKNHLFARIGGDEFVLIFIGTDNEEDTLPFFDVVNRDLERLYVDDCMKGTSITFSVGKAIYPSECQNIDELLHNADADMYKGKATN